MRRFAALAALVLVLACSLPAFAFSLDSSVCYPYQSKDGSTMAIGVFQIAGYGLPETEMALYTQAFNSTGTSRGMLTYTDGNTLSRGTPAIMMFLFPDARESLKVDFSNGEMLCREQLQVDVFIFHYPTLKYAEHANISTIAAGKMPLGKIIRAGFSLEVGSDDGSDCRVQIPAERWTLIDDRASANDSSSGFLQGILDWLGGFWDKLVGLFIPREGFFSDWFEELRTAWSQKLGGLGTLLDQIRDALDGAGKADSLIFALPEGMLFESSGGVRVDLFWMVQPLLKLVRPVLTGALVILTVIRCYRKVIDLANT